MNTVIKFRLSSNPQNLEACLAQYDRTATVEAEYGETLVSGSVITMAHHGSRAGQPAPCSYPNGIEKAETIEVVGLSHIDLDTVGGCMAILGVKPEIPSFWELAEFVDINGPHKLSECNATDEDVRRLYAYWAWSEANKTFAPRDGSVLDVDNQIAEAMRAIRIILDNNEELLKAGDEFKAVGEKLNAETFVEESGGVILRVGPSFVNHLYTSPSKEIAQVVVGFNTTTGGITVSFADKPQGLTAKNIVQEILGDQAGGHAGIAGSPRGIRCSFDDLKKVYDLARDVVSATLV